MKDDARVTGLPAPSLTLLRCPVIPEAVRLKADCADSRYNFGIDFYEQHRAGEAICQFQEALRLKPSSLGWMLRVTGSSFELANARRCS